MKRTLLNKVYSVWDVFCIRLDQLRSNICSQASLRLQGCAPSSRLRTTGNCYFKARRSGSIKIGSHATLLAGWRSNRVGLNGPLLLTTMGDGVIRIGDYFGASAVVLSSRSSISIGNNVKLGGNVRIYDHDFHSLDPIIRRSDEDIEHAKSMPVVLGDDVFIGANAIILKGVTLGERCIVGAGAVVTQSFPADTIIGGNPARLIRKSELPKP